MKSPLCLRATTRHVHMLLEMYRQILALSPSTSFVSSMYVVGPKEFQLMKNLNGVLHGSKRITFYGLLGIASGLSKRGGFDA